jgi:hypothetical protein
MSAYMYRVFFNSLRRVLGSVLFRETVAVYCENLTKHKNTIRGQNEEFSCVKACGARSNHWAFKHRTWFAWTTFHPQKLVYICWYIELCLDNVINIRMLCAVCFAIWRSTWYEHDGKDTNPISRTRNRRALFVSSQFIDWTAESQVRCISTWPNYLHQSANQCTDRTLNANRSRDRWNQGCSTFNFNEISHKIRKENKIEEEWEGNCVMYLLR